MLLLNRVTQGFPCSTCNLAKAEESRVKTVVADIINSSIITAPYGLSSAYPVLCNGFRILVQAF